jgi:hypothetical protein
LTLILKKPTKKKLDLSLALTWREIINIIRDRAEIAQPVEQGTENPRVRSSTLRLGTNKIKGLRHIGVSPFLFWSLVWSLFPLSIRI